MKKLLDKNPETRLSAKDALNVAYDLREEIEKNELLEQFEQLDSNKEGMLSLRKLKKYFKLEINNDCDKKVNFEEFYKIVVNSVKID